MNNRPIYDAAGQAVTDFSILSVELEQDSTSPDRYFCWMPEDGAIIGVVRPAYGKLKPFHIYHGPITLHVACNPLAKRERKTYRIVAADAQLVMVTKPLVFIMPLQLTKRRDGNQYWGYLYQELEP